jgi:hypothetical protein
MESYEAKRWERLCRENTSKGEKFADCGRTIDYALPRNWLVEFARWCDENCWPVTYDMIASTTVWVYPESKPMTACTEVAEAFEDWHKWCEVNTR